MTDLVLANATIVDGTGAPARPGSVLVDGDRIEAVLGPGASMPGGVGTIDAAGAVVAPGFVDVHSHSDLSPLVEPTMDSMLRQGVTTIVVGNCGASAYPASDPGGMAALVGGNAEALDLEWRSFGEYLERIDAAGPALNVAALVGHGTLREAAMREQRRPPTSEEMTAMRSMLSEALEQGAVGLSTGLIYAPGLHATTDEIVELASAAQGTGALYTSHVRGEAETVFDAVSECIEVGRRAGTPSHVSHLKVETRPMWGRAAVLLALIDRERAAGADVTADQYPYTAWETELASALPPWVTADELPSVLADADARERLGRAIEDGEPGWASVGRGIGWERVVVGSHLPDRTVTGRSIADVAAERDIAPFEAIAELLVADRYTGMLGHAMDEGDVRTIASRPDVFVATDGVAVSPTGPLGAFAVHPRYYGTFPRVLRAVREEGWLTLEAAVRKMTSLPADRFGLAGRGRIAPGAAADLVVFDATEVRDVATYDRPHAFAEGIHAVVVNGTVAWNGSAVGRAGRAVRRGER